MYAYAANNPVRYIDPDGREVVPEYDIRDPTEEQLKKFYNARSSAKNNLDSLLSALKSPSFKKESAKIKESAKNWLGLDLSKEENITLLKGKIENIIKGIDEIKGLKMDYGEKHKGDMGYVKGEYDKIIYGSGEYDLLGDSGNDTFQGFIVHEISHRYANTVDVELENNKKAYGLKESYKLPEDKKILNGDNWEYFYEYLYTGGTPRWDE